MFPLIYMFVYRRRNLLVSRFMSNSKSQSKACVLINGATAVFAAHATDGCKSWRKEAVK